MTTSELSVRLVDSDDLHHAAATLLSDMYSTRRYLVPEAGKHRRDTGRNEITLAASVDGEVVGTISVRFDSEFGLLADQAYQRELDSMRAQGRRLCEFTRLAVARSARSRHVLAALSHTSLIHAHLLRRHSDVVIEVNPTHAGFYELMLGFTRVGSERHNPRAGAPCVLLRLDLSHAARELNRLGGTARLGTVERSLYPYGFSPADQDAIVRSLAATS